MTPEKTYMGMWYKSAPDDTPVYIIAPQDSYPQKANPLLLGQYFGILPDNTPLFAVQNRVWRYRESPFFLTHSGERYRWSGEAVFVSYKDGPPPWFEPFAHNIEEYRFVGDWQVYVKLPDSEICGGAVANIQLFLVSRELYLHPVPVKVKAKVSGNITRWASSTTWAYISVYPHEPGHPELFVDVKTPKDGDACQMTYIENQGELVFETSQCSVWIWINSGWPFHSNYDSWFLFELEFELV